VAKEEGAGPVVLILAAGRDGALTCQLLEESGYHCHRCESEEALLAALLDQTGAVVVAGEMLTVSFAQRIAGVVAAQPPWSDLPFIAVTHPEHRLHLQALRMLGNVSVLTRPMTPDSLVSAVESAVRARVRQFQVRDLLAAQQLQARRKDEFLAMLAHELRNPLAPIRYSAHALQLPTLTPEKVGRTAVVIERQVAHMGSIIDQLLDVSRITRGVIHLEKRPVNFSDLVTACAETHRSSAQPRGIALALREPVPQAWVEGDETRLTQVVSNLFDNAVKFSPTGTRIEVSLEASDGWARLRVSDQGEGIAPADLPHLFEPFVQADRTLARTRGGLGLGLALVKGLVDLHGGSVRALSEGPGFGSTFVVTLPTVAAPASAAAPAEHAAGSGGSLSVLIAEDNVDAAETLRMLLDAMGYQVSVANTGPDAVQLALAMRPDVVVCDIGLPGMSGYEVARTLRDNADLAGTRLIAVTGYGTEQDRAAALAAGFEAHFRKPVSPQELIDELSKIAARKVPRST
jgi:signal transduction histidine kinase/ActR/RegA family two-component response regulator